MDLNKALATARSSGDFQPFEDAWLEVLEEETNLEALLPLARELAHEDEEVAKSLLELLDESLRDQEDWHRRVQLLRETGEILFAPEDLHREILETLELIHESRPSFASLVEKVGLHRAITDVPKTWVKVDRLNDILSCDVGTIVWMEGKGAGRVRDVNLTLEGLRVDFEEHKDLNVGFSLANRLLHPLPEGHVLRHKLEDPETLERLRDEDPAELLHRVFCSYPKSLGAGDIRKTLSGIVSDKGWNTWWSKARKDPRIVLEPGGRQHYRWAESAAEAEGSIWEEFSKADVAGKLDWWTRHSGRSETLRERMLESLQELGASLAAEEAFQIGAVLERSGVEVQELPWRPALLVQSAEDFGALTAGLGDRSLRDRAYELARETRDDWRNLLLQAFLAEEDRSLLQHLGNLLSADAPEEWEVCLKEALGQPQKRPHAFGFLAELAATDASIRDRNPLGFLQHILNSLSDPATPSLRTRLSALTESGSTIPRLLAQLTEDQAPQALSALERANGLESHQRDLLRSAIQLRFPDLASTAEEPFYATEGALEARRKELKHLGEVEIPANRKAIQEARELGDLSENFEYKSARQRHEYLSSRLAALTRDLARARPLDLSQVDPADIRVGTRARLQGQKGTHRDLTILGPWESDPDQGVLSHESDAAKALLGRKVGDEVELEGEVYEVVVVERCG